MWKSINVRIIKLIIRKNNELDLLLKAIRRYRPINFLGYRTQYKLDC
ncbi:Uncharacterised protein [Sphingobacterium thalpophilum]|uniref:Uncharacterized protein n=1 Tax=Sphingobacterium thalpophilum TaxID=259 RepID=A0A4U9VKT6_9SPHI|nr:Uncharacterised protein [Sphingobacterium thalpophilum]